MLKHVAVIKEGTLIKDGKMNEALVDWLKQSNFSQIYLVTDRSMEGQFDNIQKQLQNCKVSNRPLNRYIATESILQELQSNGLKNVIVSTRGDQLCQLHQFL